MVEKISVLIELITSKFKTGVGDIQKGIRTMAQRFQWLSQQTGRPIWELKRRIAGVGLAVTKTGRFVDLGTGRFVSFNAAVIRVKKGMTRFRMELLSVMFFGQALQRTFMGLIQPALDVVGIFDLLTATLQVVFLPIALAILDVLLPILDWFMNLPEPIQMAIGVFTLLGVALGTIMLWFGQIGLGIQGLGLLFPGLAASITSAGGGILGFFKVMGSSIMGLLTNPWTIAILAIIAVIVLLYLAWKNNWFGFRDVVKTVWDAFLKPVFDTIKIVVGILAEAFKIAFGIITQVIRIAWGIISIPLNFLWGIFEGFIKSIFPDVKDAWKFLWDTIGSSLLAVWNVIKPPLMALWDLLKGIADFLGVVAGGARTIGQWIGGAIGGLFGGRPVGYQYGGIVTKPTIAMVGERGPEAIVPLNKAGGYGGTIYASPSFHISASISNDIDIRSLAEKLNNYFFTDLRRLTGGF